MNDNEKNAVEAKRTMDYDAEIQRVRRGGDKDDVERDWPKLHVHGLYEEAGEVVSLLRKAERGGRPVDRARLTDELGDTCSYLALIAQDKGSSFAELVRCQVLYGPLSTRSSDWPALDEFVTSVGEVASVHSMLVRGMSWDVALLRALVRCLRDLLELALVHGIVLEDMQRANVAKLRARFPSRYTIAAAEAKADEKADEKGFGR